MAQKQWKPEDLACSFCGKRADAISKLIAGPGIYICNECVALCNQILAGEFDQTATIAALEGQTTEQLLDRLAGVGTTFASLETSVRDAVGVLRQRGITWAQIGGALRISRQAAWERFAGEE